MEQLYQKPLPPSKSIGESWEITDRPEGVSVIANGSLAGKNLRWLMDHYPLELLGSKYQSPSRFPLLIKILDAQKVLSLQVHPPAQIARQLGGEPKTEMWYITQASPSAELFAGLKTGVTKPEFEKRLQDGSVADCFHRIPIRAGDSMFLPSGRVHAIGAGNVIFEIQQNSDTTYRVFDWNRLDDQGKPRDLHIPQSLASIDFSDFEPAPLPADPSASQRLLTSNPLFTVEELHLTEQSLSLIPGLMVILGIISGHLHVQSPIETLHLFPGSFVLIPAAATSVSIRSHNARFLKIHL